MNKYVLKETLYYPNKHKAIDNIDSINILIYHNSEPNNYEIAYYDWYGDINLHDIVEFVEITYHLSKIKILTINDGNGRVNITYLLT
jgi:hypothetical protein